MKVVKLNNQNDFIQFSDLFRKFLKSLDNSVYSEEIKNDLITGFTHHHLTLLYNRLDSCFYIAKDKRKIIGFIFGWAEHGVFWIDWVGVSQQYRSKGLGAHLFDSLIKDCQQRKYHKIAFNTIDKNIRAIELYKRIGFKEEAIMENHWYKENWVYLSKEI